MVAQNASPKKDSTLLKSLALAASATHSPTTTQDCLPEQHSDLRTCRTPRYYPARSPRKAHIPRNSLIPVVPHLTYKNPSTPKKSRLLEQGPVPSGSSPPQIIGRVRPSIFGQQTLLPTLTSYRRFRSLVEYTGRHHHLQFVPPLSVLDPSMPLIRPSLDKGAPSP